MRGILTTSGHGVLVTGEAVTANYFDLLGTPPALGRGFRTDEDRAAGAAPVVVLSHGLWQRRFGARPNVLGETVKLSGTEYTVIGVAPSRFTGTLPGIPTEFWVPVTMVERLQFSGVQMSKEASDTDPALGRLARRGTRWLFVKGRLADGRTVEDARAQLETIYARLSRNIPPPTTRSPPASCRSSSVRFHPMLDGYVKAASAGLLVAVSLVLLVACANVANMLLARGAARQRELAIRARSARVAADCLGSCSPKRWCWPSAGGALGVLIAWWSARSLSGLGSNVFPMPIAFDFSIDRTVLGFALSVSAATAVLFGLAPAWSASRPELVPALKAAAENLAAGASRRATCWSSVSWRCRSCCSSPARCWAAAC